MQIIQISDMHINHESNIADIKKKIYKLSISLKSELRQNDCTVICILGDIVDKGDATKYKDASVILNYIKDVFAEFSPTFEFTPGNHDLCECLYPNQKPESCNKSKCSLESFTMFAKTFDEDYMPASIVCKDYPTIYLVLVNSVFHKNCKYGLVDIESLEGICIPDPKPALIVTHHTFLSENNTDASAIRNAYKVFEAIEKKEIIGVLHGHTHGYKDITVGSNCPIIGVGPFLKEVPDVNNQVNLVIVSETGIQKVINYYYMRDRDDYLYDIVFAKTESVYKGNTVQKAYSKILYDTKNTGVISNMILNISMPYQQFNEEIEGVFSEQISIAELWQETEKVPDTLYYNHGQYMQHKGVPAVDFVIEELKSKATSSRSIIPLINFDQVINSGDGFLPSFDLVQFGFQHEDKKQLFITLYLRALEVNHFLKINLCEIYLMCKKVAEQIRSIDSIDITVIAFRAQYKENYGCFARAKIDIMTEADIAVELSCDPTSFAALIEEKRNLCETVVETKGIISLVTSLHALNKKKIIKSSILEQSQATLCKLESLKKEREKTSNYLLIEPLEKQVAEELDKLTVLFREGTLYES